MTCPTTQERKEKHKSRWGTKWKSRSDVKKEGKHKDSATKLDLLDYNLTKLTRILDRVMGSGNFWYFQFRTINQRGN
jgi:hypothetical protein